MELGDHVHAGKFHPESLGTEELPVPRAVFAHDALYIKEADTLTPILTWVNEPTTAALAGKQNTLTVVTSSPLQTYPNGNMSLTGDTLTFVQPPFVDWTVDQGDTNIDANNVPLLPYASQTLAGNNTPGLTSYNFTAARKTKLESVPNWMPATDPQYLQRALDFNLPDTHYVQNPIGNVHSGRTVAQLENDYSTVQLIEAMLKLEGAPQQFVSISGAALTITSTGGDREFGTSYPSTLELEFDRGQWQNAIGANVLPHPGDGIVTLNGLGLTNSTLTPTTSSITVSSPATIDYETTGISGSFTGNETLTASLLTGSTSTGSVLDNYGVSTSGPVSQTFGPVSLSFTVYKPLFVNNSKITSNAIGSAGGGGQSGDNGTVKVFSSTTAVIMVDHVYNHTIEIPFEPSTLQMYVEFGNTGWSTQTTWSKASGTRTINGQPNVVYWTVTWTGSARSQVDVKIY